VKTSALSRLLGVAALERLQFQTLAVRDATGEVLVDCAVAAGLDVVHAAADLVVATHLNFLGLVAIGLASPFVLEGFRALDPGASQSAINLASAIALDASDSADGGLVAIDVAFVADVVLEVAVAIVQAFAVGDATGGLDQNLLAAEFGAGEPEFAGFEGVTGVVLFAVFHASDLDQFAAVVDGFLAFVQAVVLGHLLLLGDAFAGVHASFVGHGQDGLGGEGLAGVEVVCVFESFSDFVLLTVLNASSWVEGQIIASGFAFAAVVLVVVVAADLDLG